MLYIFVLDLQKELCALLHELEGVFKVFERHHLHAEELHAHEKRYDGLRCVRRRLAHSIRRMGPYWIRKFVIKTIIWQDSILHWHSSEYYLNLALNWINVRYRKELRKWDGANSIRLEFTLSCTPGVRRKIFFLSIEILTVLERQAPLRIRRRSDECSRRSGPKWHWKAQHQRFRRPLKCSQYKMYVVQRVKLGKRVAVGKLELWFSLLTYLCIWSVWTQHPRYSERDPRGRDERAVASALRSIRGWRWTQSPGRVSPITILIPNGFPSDRCNESKSFPTKNPLITS